MRSLVVVTDSTHPSHPTLARPRLHLYSMQMLTHGAIMLYIIFFLLGAYFTNGVRHGSYPEPRDAIVKNVTAMIVDATKVHRATAFHYGTSYAEHAAVEDAIEHSRVIQHLYIPSHNTFPGSNFSNRFRLRCPGWTCNSTQTPCIPLEHQRSPNHLESSNEALWWKMFKSQFEARLQRSQGNGTYGGLNILLHPQSDRIISPDCHLAFDSGKTLRLQEESDRKSLLHYESRFVLFLDDRSSDDDTYENGSTEKRMKHSRITLSKNKTMSLVEARSWLPSKTNPCYHQIIDLTNCVKDQQDIRKCSSKKESLAKCETINQIESKTYDTKNHRHGHSEKSKGTDWQQNSFSFRSCAGLSKGCPSSGGAPPGELAGKMQLPPPPKDKSGPSPAGPDTTDSAGLIVMCIDHTTMGSLVPQTVDHFANKAQQEWPRVLTVSLIDGIPSNGNVDGAGGAGQPSNGDGPGEYSFREMRQQSTTRARMMHMIKTRKQAPQVKYKPPKAKVPKDAITQAKETVEKTSNMVEEKTMELKNIIRDTRKVRSEAQKALADAKIQAKKAALEKDVETRELETKKAKDMEQNAIVKLDLVATMNDEIIKASKRSHEAAERAAAAKIHLRNLLREQAEKKEMKKHFKKENASIVPTYRGITGEVNHTEHADTTLRIHDHIGTLRNALVTSLTLVKVFTEMALADLNFGEYSKALQALSDAERSGVMSSRDVRATKMAALNAKYLQYIRPNASAPGDHNGNPIRLSYHYHAKDKPISMRFRSKSSLKRSLTKLLPIREYEEDHENVPGRFIPLPLLKRARVAAEKDNDSRYAVMDAIAAKSVLEELMSKCEKEKQLVEDANENMDNSLRVVAKALVDQHMLYEENGKMEEKGDGKNSTAIPPELVQNVKRVRIICESLLEEVKDICKITISDALMMAKLAWIKARIKNIDSARDHRHYERDMAKYVGSLYEDALASADDAVRQDEIETKNTTAIKHAIDREDDALRRDDLHYKVSRVKKYKPERPARKAPTPPPQSKEKKAKPSETKESPIVLSYKHKGKLYDDIDPISCKSPNCNPGIAELKAKTSFLETNQKARGRPHLLGIRTGLGALPKLITNELMHSMTTFFVKEVTEEFTYRMTPEIANSVLDSVKGETINYLATRLSKILDATLKRSLYFSVPATFNAVLPGQILDNSQNILTNILTRSITHALVPSLTYSLSNVRDLNKYSFDCSLTPTGPMCQKESRVLYSKVGMSNYYSAFFSDYYSDYYTDKRKLENLDPPHDGMQDE